MRPTGRTILRRVGKWIGILGIVLAVTLLAFVLLVVYSASLRNLILRQAISRGARRAPGTLVVESASWPRFSQLEIAGLRWTEEADTLVHLDRLKVSFRVIPLFRGDVDLAELVVGGLAFDVGALQSVRESASPDRAIAPEAPRRRLFPREGAVAGVPSVRVEGLCIEEARGRLADGSVYEAIEMSGDIDLLHGHAPVVRLSRLSVQAKRQQWGVEEGRIECDFDQGVLEAYICGRSPGDLPWVITAATDDRGSFTLRVGPGEGSFPPEAVGLAAQGRFVREDAHVRSLDFTALVMTPGTQELARVPPLSVLARLAPLEGLQAAISGTLAFRPEFRGSVRLEIQRNQWMSGGGFLLTIAGDELSLEDLSVTLPGLLVAGAARGDEERIEGEILVEVRGTKWLESLYPGGSLPDSLSFLAAITVGGARSSPSLEMRGHGGFRWGRAHIEWFSADVRIRELMAKSADFQLRAQGAGMEVRSDGVIEWPVPVSARLAPVELRVIGRQRAREAQAIPANSTVEFDAATGRLRLEGLRVVGDLGEMDVSGTLAPEGEGFMRANLTWPELPALLAGYLTPGEHEADSVASRWSSDGPFEMNIEAMVSPRDAAPGRIEVGASFKLPGPRVFSPLLPPGVSLDSLGAIRGGVDGTLIMGSRPATWEFRIKVDQSDWIETGLLTVRSRQGTATIDTLRLATNGMEFSASASHAAGRWDLAARAHFPHAGMLRRLVPGLPPGTDFTASTEAQLRGKPKLEELRVDLTGRLITDSFQLEDLQASADWTGGKGLRARLGIGQGVVAKGFTLDRLAASYASAAEPGVLPVPGSARVEASGPEWRLLQTLEIGRTDRWSVVGDTLSMFLGGKDIGCRGPYRVTVSPEKGEISLESLNLAGSLGSVEARAVCSRDTIGVWAEVALDLSQPPAGLPFPEGLSLGELRARLSAEGEDLRAQAEITGLGLGTRRRLEGRVEVTSSGDALRLTSRLEDEREIILEATSHIPANLRLYPPALRMEQGPLRVDVDFHSFPLPAPSAGPPYWVDYLRGTAQELAFSWTGQVALRGPAETPSVGVKGQVSFPPGSDLSRYRLPLELWLIPSRGLDPHLVEVMGRPSAVPDIGDWDISTGPALLTGFHLDRDANRVCQGGFLVPLIFEGGKGKLQVSLGDPMRALVETPELALADFNPLLPGSMDMRGRMQFRVAAAGPTSDPLLEGSFHTEEIRVSLVDGTKVSLRSSVGIGGSSKRPSLRGHVEILSGTIMIPDPPRTLHPATGKAVLWEEAKEETGNVEESPTVVGHPAPLRDDLAESPPKGGIRPDFDITVRIPGRFWLRGQGLEVELAGDLRIVQLEGDPVLTGELHAVRGDLLFLGRRFTIDKGEVTFLGEDEINPALDLRLSHNLAGMLFHVLVSGRAKAPRLNLVSEPEMTEGDILAHLVFGRPLDELDSDQASFVQSRAAEVAGTWAMAKLEARLSRELGVDMLSVGTGAGGGRSLVMGKYLSRRALLRYEQSLRTGRQSALNLEYWLARNIELVTHISRQANSGIELNWSRDY